MSKEFFIDGTYGSFSVHVDSGKVLSYTEETNEEGVSYSNIVQFDVKELETFWDYRIKEKDSYDILDVGYWTNTGFYAPPDVDYRLRQVLNAQESKGFLALRKLNRIPVYDEAAILPYIEKDRQNLEIGSLSRTETLYYHKTTSSMFILEKEKHWFTFNSSDAGSLMEHFCQFSPDTQVRCFYEGEPFKVNIRANIKYQKDINQIELRLEKERTPKWRP